MGTPPQFLQPGRRHRLLAAAGPGRGAGLGRRRCRRPLPRVGCARQAAGRAARQQRQAIRRTRSPRRLLARLRPCRRAARRGRGARSVAAVAGLDAAAHRWPGRLTMARTALDALIRPLQHRSPQTGLHLHNEAHSEAGGPFHSYPALYRMVCAAMHSCQAQGIVKGSRVIVPFATSIDSIVGFLALIGIGALPLSVKTPASGGGRAEYVQFLQLLTRRFGVSAILATAGLERQAMAQSTALPLLTISTELAATRPAPWAEPGLDDIAFVQFSSGTTAEPKGVPIRHDQLIRQLELILSQDARSASDVGASWLPLYHDMGLVGALLSSMHAGLRSRSARCCRTSRFASCTTMAAPARKARTARSCCAAAPWPVAISKDLR